MEKEMNPIQLIKQDHRTVKGLFRKFEKANRTADKQKIGQEIIEELSIHAAIEEQLIYPLLNARGRKLEQPVLNALEEHHAVKLILAELDKMSADHERYDAKMHVVQESVEEHIEEEEAKLLPRLDEMLDANDRNFLATSMLELKQAVPNHPHPGAPDTPPGALFAGLIAKVADAGKDVVRRMTSDDKAAGHRRVQRRASAAIRRTSKSRRRSRGGSAIGKARRKPRRGTKTGRARAR
jgi:hemerythrin superfamily protein